jgi:hypothetical protein
VTKVFDTPEEQIAYLQRLVRVYEADAQRTEAMLKVVLEEIVLALTNGTAIQAHLSLRNIQEIMHKIIDSPDIGGNMSTTEVIDSLVTVPWRTGTSVHRTIYAMPPGSSHRVGEVLIGLMDTPELAREVVEAHNEHVDARKNERAHE